MSERTRGVKPGAGPGASDERRDRDPAKKTAAWIAPVLLGVIFALGGMGFGALFAPNAMLKGALFGTALGAVLGIGAGLATNKSVALGIIPGSYQEGIF